MANRYVYTAGTVPDRGDLELRSFLQQEVENIARQFTTVRAMRQYGALVLQNETVTGPDDYLMRWIKPLEENGPRVDPQNGRITVVETGDYRINVQARGVIGPALQTGVFLLELNRGATSYFQSVAPAPELVSTGWHLGWEAMLSLVRGDDMRIRFQTGNGETWTIQHATFVVERIG